MHNLEAATGLLLAVLLHSVGAFSSAPERKRATPEGMNRKLYPKHNDLYFIYYMLLCILTHPYLK